MTQESNLATKLKSLLAYADKVSLRERLLVFASVMMLLGSVWYLGLIQPLTQRATDSRTEIEAVQSRINTTNQSLEDQVQQVSGTSMDYRKRIARMQLRIDDMDKRLGYYTAELIDPAQMARVLEGVLKKQTNLRLRRIRNLSPEALSGSDDTGNTIFYKHGLEIEFVGSYLACLEYLQELEALPWRIYWQFLELEVLKYPRNRIRLEITTLSLDAEWIGA
ncbi:MAG: type II secretion system protein GspM [Pseudomonadales bacterium]